MTQNTRDYLIGELISIASAPRSRYVLSEDGKLVEHPQAAGMGEIRQAIQLLIKVLKTWERFTVDNVAAGSTCCHNATGSSPAVGAE